MSKQMSLKDRIREIRKDQEEGPSVTQKELNKIVDEVILADKEGRDPVIPEGYMVHVSKQKDTF